LTIFIIHTSDIQKYKKKRKQKENEEINVFSGLAFPKEGEEGTFDYQSLSTEQKMAMSRLSSEQIAELMNAYTENKNASYEKNLDKLSAIDLESPSAINIYPKDFEAKDKISNAIEEYNQKQKDEGKEENTIKIDYVVSSLSMGESIPEDLLESFQTQYTAVQIQKAGITQEQLQAMFTQFDVNVIQTDENAASGNIFISMMISIALFFAIYFCVYQVSTSITTEKTSKIMETLVTSTSPRTIVLGKTIGIGINRHDTKLYKLNRYSSSCNNNLLYIRILTICIIICTNRFNSK